MPVQNSSTALALIASPPVPPASGAPRAAVAALGVVGLVHQHGPKIRARRDELIDLDAGGAGDQVLGSTARTRRRAHRSTCPAGTRISQPRPVTWVPGGSAAAAR